MGIGSSFRKFFRKVDDELNEIGIEKIVIGAVVTWINPAWGMKYFATVAASHALAPDMPDMSQNKGSTVNTRSSVSPLKYIYGKVRTGGNIDFAESTGTDNKFLHMNITILGNPVDEITGVYINDEIVTIDASNNVTDERWTSSDGTPCIRIITHDGTQTTADSTLVAETSAGSTFVGNDIVYLYIRLKNDADVFTNGIPNITPVIKGNKVYDPRDTTTAWSDNSALCIRDYIKAAYGLADPDVDEASFSAAANHCDELVTLADGTTQKRFTINGVVNSESTTGQILKDMLATCDGRIFRSGGLWKIKVGVYTASIKSFTLDDLRSGFTLPTRRSRSQNFNEITGKFIDEASDWVETDYPPIKSATALAEDNNIENSIDLSFNMVTNSARAQRIAKQTLLRNREQMSFEADFSLNALGLEVGDVVDLTISDYGWTNKEFEVLAWGLKFNSQGGVVVNLKLVETSSTAFDWDAEEQEIINNNTTLPAYYLAPDVGVSASPSLRIVNEQVTGVLTIDVSNTSDQADRFEVQYKPSAETTYIALGQDESTRREALGVQDGYYDFRARSINALGARGNWNTVSNYFITIFAAPPQQVSNFAGNVVGNTLHLTWSPVTDLDLSHYKIRYASAVAGASYQNARDIVAKVSRPANSITVPSQTGTYFIKAVDKMGNLSEQSSSITVSVSTVDIDNLNVVATLTENSAFAGAKTDVVKITDGSDIYITLPVTGAVVQSLTGIYEFNSPVDLGQVYISRVSTSMTIDYLDYANTFTQAAGLFTEREGNFTGDPSQFDTTSARTQVAHTDDDPASGSATWTDWADFIVGDIKARGIKFRVILSTKNTSAAPAIRTLSATIDMPDRTESQGDITYTGTTNIVFPTAFKETPVIAITAVLLNQDHYGITNRSRTGFTITTFHSGGTNPSTNATTIDYIATGYGKDFT